MNKLFIIVLIAISAPQAFAEQYSCEAICLQTSSASHAVNWSFRLPTIVVDNLANASKVLLGACQKQNGNGIASFLETASVSNGDYGIQEEKIIEEKPFEASLCQKFNKEQARMMPNEYSKTVEATAQPDHE